MLNYYLKHIYLCGHISIPVEQKKGKKTVLIFFKKWGPTPQ